LLEQEWSEPIFNVIAYFSGLSITGTEVSLNFILDLSFVLEGTEHTISAPSFLTAFASA